MALDHNEQAAHYEPFMQEVAEIVASVDPHRPPQRNDDNSSNRCNCPCAREASQDDRDPIIAENSQDDMIREVLEAIEQYEFVIRPPRDGSEISGDEGVESYLDVDEEMPFAPFPSPDEAYSLEGSMFVEPGSRELSMESSLATLPSRNSSVFMLAGGWADSAFIAPPLRLTAEVLYCYPLELEMA
jgi:hypothetical protein